jgi:3',5'-cyclic AMP phosphodiesterase CpdA
VSDLHVGRGGELSVLPALRGLVLELEPDLLLATGDLAHRGRSRELGRAAELLRGLDLPLLAVPGNHDIPFTVPARFTQTFGRWEQVFGPREPVLTSESVVVVGLSSVRPWRQQGGLLEDDQLERAEARLAAAPVDALRVVALHHHLAAPPWRVRRKRPLAHRDAVLRRLAGAGAELVASGHVHQAAVAERREFEVLEGESKPSIVLATAPGLGRPRPRRAGEAQGANLYEADDSTLSVTTFAWNGNILERTGRRSFSRG